MKSIFDYLLNKTDKSEIISKLIYEFINNKEKKDLSLLCIKENGVRLKTEIGNNILKIELSEDIDYNKNNYIYFNAYKNIHFSGLEYNSLYIGKYIDITTEREKRKKENLSMFYNEEFKKFKYITVEEEEYFKHYIKFIIDNDLFFNLKKEEIIENIEILYDTKIKVTNNMNYLEERIDLIKKDITERNIAKEELKSKLVRESIKKLMNSTF